MWVQIINKVKFTHQGQGQIKVILKERCSYMGGLHLNQIHSFYDILYQVTRLILVIKSGTIETHVELIGLRAARFRNANSFDLYDLFDYIKMYWGLYCPHV